MLSLSIFEYLHKQATQCCVTLETKFLLSYKFGKFILSQYLKQLTENIKSL